MLLFEQRSIHMIIIYSLFAFISNMVKVFFKWSPNKCSINFETIVVAQQ